MRKRKIEKVYLCKIGAADDKWIHKSQQDDEELKCIYDLTEINPDGCAMIRQRIPKEKCSSYTEFNVCNRDYDNPRRKEDKFIC